MFSRRHPFLFSILVFTAITCNTIVIVLLIFLIGFKQMDRDEKRIADRAKIGVVEVTGPIRDARTVINDIKRFREQKDIRAIVVRVDSPGGSAGPSQEIYREIRKTSAVKKVVASMGSVAASGGYYVAAGADKIMASPGTITGSIGVIMGFTNVRQLMDKIGLAPVVVKSGRFKDVGSPVRQMSAEETALLEGVVSEIHRQFIHDVAESRQMAVTEVKNLADGRIFTGETGMEHGYIDRLGNLEDALQWAGELAGVEGKVAPVYPPEDKVRWIKRLAENSIQDLIETLARERLTAGL